MRSFRNVQSQAGYSVIEILVVMGLMGILAAMAVIQITASQPAFKGDGAMRVVLSQMRIARELAITQRRYMRVTFVAPNIVQIIREEVPGPATTMLGSTVIEGGVQFALVSGVPDTPDAFGFGASVDFGTVTNVKFTPDGTLVDQDGVTTNGSVFLAISSVQWSARAITVLGSTGRIRGYRWDGRIWKLV